MNATMHRNFNYIICFANENMKNQIPASSIEFLSNFEEKSAQLAGQKQFKSQILFHRNSSPHDLYIQLHTLLRTLTKADLRFWQVIIEYHVHRALRTIIRPLLC